MTAVRSSLRRPPVLPGAVFGVGLGGSVDGIVLHQILQWHHLVAARTPADTLEGLQRNTLADGLFQVATTAVIVLGAVLLRRDAAGRRGGGGGRATLGAVLLGFGAFHLVDEVVLHLLLEAHHIRMVEDYLVYDVGFTALGVVLVAAGYALLRGRAA